MYILGFAYVLCGVGGWGFVLADGSEVAGAFGGGGDLGWGRGVVAGTCDGVGGWGDGDYFWGVCVGAERGGVGCDTGA